MRLLAWQLKNWRFHHFDDYPSRLPKSSLEYEDWVDLETFGDKFKVIHKDYQVIIKKHL